MHKVMGKHYFLVNVLFRNRWVSLVDIFMPFVIIIEAKLRELGKNDVADMLLQKKDEVIDFLKTQAWTSEDMNQDWFVDADGDHYYGVKTEDNELKPKTH